MSGAAAGGPMITAKFSDGPLAGTSAQVAAVAGRPPSTIDAGPADGRVRYCLESWTQSGHSAVYSYLYEI